MNSDISTHDALRLLGRSEHGRAAFDRRRFLKLVGAGLGAGMLTGPASSLLDISMPGVDPSAWAMGPLGPDDKILILIGMWGGNDGLNTIVPIDDGRYYDQHGPLAIAPGDTLALTDDRGLNPALTRLESFWDAGHLAIVEGIGYPNPNLSHFDSMATWMSGRPVGPTETGWVGRWLDHHLDGNTNLYAAVEVGHNLQLLMRGDQARGTAVAPGPPAFGVSQNVRDQRLYASMRALNAADAATWHGRVGQAFEDQLDLAQTLDPVVPAADQFSSATIVSGLEMIGHLVNANLGFRVLTTGWNDFDSHANQPDTHPVLMSELNAAITRLFEILHPDWAARVTVITYSEFGRTSWSNDGAGTDHGTAAPHFVISHDVNGGFYGERPSLSGLGRWDRMAHTVDYRDYFGSVIDGMLGGGAAEVFDGRPVDDLGLFGTPDDPDPEPLTPPPPTSPPPSGGGGTPTVPVVAAPTADDEPPAVTTRTGSEFVAISPERIYDTRTGTGGRSGPIGASETVHVQVTGVGGVPTSGISAVALNVTSVNPTSETNFRVFPTGIPVPYASSLNPQPGRAVPNMVIVGVGNGGKVSVFNEIGTVDCIVDVVGYFHDGPATAFTPLVPARLLDTRAGNGAPAARVMGGSVIELDVAGRSGVPVGADAVVLNVGSVTPSADGYVTVWRHGQPRPDVSNLNYTAGRNIPNLAICQLGHGGKIDLFVSDGDLDLIADVVGFYSASGTARHVAITPVRLLDTRLGVAPAPLAGDTEIVLNISGGGNNGGVPATATSAIVNVTAVNATADTYVTVYPDGVSRPDASSLNVTEGDTIANLVVVKLGSNGAIRLFNSNGAVDLIADVSGYFA
jgi:uncharacterized protein (DUF1501 family)